MCPLEFKLGGSKCPPGAILPRPYASFVAQQLTELGLLQYAPDGRAPNAKAYLKPKSAQKCALIVNMIRVNDHFLPPPPFKLPQLDDLSHTITLALLRGTPLYFTTLDISNMFWSCKIPPQFQHRIRIGVRGQVFSFPGFPFGWRASLVIETTRHVYTTVIPRRRRCSLVYGRYPRPWPTLTTRPRPNNTLYNTLNNTTWW